MITLSCLLIALGSLAAIGLLASFGCSWRWLYRTLTALCLAASGGVVLGVLTWFGQEMP